MHDGIYCSSSFLSPDSFEDTDPKEKSETLHIHFEGGVLRSWGYPGPSEIVTIGSGHLSCIGDLDKEWFLPSYCIPSQHHYQNKKGMAFLTVHRLPTAPEFGHPSYMPRKLNVQIFSFSARIFIAWAMQTPDLSSISIGAFERAEFLHFKRQRGEPSHSKRKMGERRGYHQPGYSECHCYWACNQSAQCHGDPPTFLGHFNVIPCVHGPAWPPNHRIRTPSSTIHQSEPSISQIDQSEVLSSRKRSDKPVMEPTERLNLLLVFPNLHLLYLSQNFSSQMLLTSTPLQEKASSMAGSRENSRTLPFSPLS
ncbi:hypothetical protein VNO77_34516 [Canavalia gladiata]|uniref:Uncharacterized protein n=1 Tax=Canavalia gladiata TaxID=3824 RepID=A0AAN9PZV3_CANGL